MIKASEPVRMKTLLMTKKKYRQTVRGREYCGGLWVSEKDMMDP